jgi:hypothetical protein
LHHIKNGEGGSGRNHEEKNEVEAAGLTGY